MTIYLCIPSIPEVVDMVVHSTVSTFPKISIPTSVQCFLSNMKKHMIEAIWTNNEVAIPVVAVIPIKMMDLSFIWERPS